MCKYRDNKYCKKTGSICPWAQWCGKINAYKERAGAEKYCKFLHEEQEDAPDGYYKVEFERHGYLYINFKNDIIKILNPFEDVPNFVKVRKNKTTYKLSK